MGGLEEVVDERKIDLPSQQRQQPRKQRGSSRNASCSVFCLFVCLSDSKGLVTEKWIATVLVVVVVVVVLILTMDR